MFRWIAVTAFAALLGGCATFNTLNNEVSTFGAWPAERKPASYVFERLPSQEAQPEPQQRLEDAASGALQQAGFMPAADPRHAEYLMQVDARLIDHDSWRYNDPLIRYGAIHDRWAMGVFRGPGWGLYDSPRNVERSVALLIRDRQTGQLLYEARASNNGVSASIYSLLPAMFEAAMKDFPSVGPNPRNVTVELRRP